MKNDLDNLPPEKLGRLFPIIIEDYNPEWSEIFESEKKIILESFDRKQITRIEHFGSTAVKDLAAKPTIDIILEINKLDNEDKFIEDLKKLNYRFIPRPENPAPHMMFVKGYTDDGFKGQTFHIHVRYKGNWDELYFRDYLRQNPETAKQYAKLKIQLAEKYKFNREDYTEAKTEFIIRITELARKIFLLK